MSLLPRPTGCSTAGRKAHLVSMCKSESTSAEGECEAEPPSVASDKPSYVVGVSQASAKNVLYVLRNIDLAYN